MKNVKKAFFYKTLFFMFIRCSNLRLLELRLNFRLLQKLCLRFCHSLFTLDSLYVSIFIFVREMNKIVLSQFLYVTIDQSAHIYTEHRLLQTKLSIAWKIFSNLVNRVFLQTSFIDPKLTRNIVNHEIVCT